MFREHLQGLRFIPLPDFVDGVRVVIAGCGILDDDFDGGDRRGLLWRQFVKTAQGTCFRDERTDVRERQAPNLLEGPGCRQIRAGELPGGAGLDRRRDFSILQQAATLGASRMFAVTCTDSRLSRIEVFQVLCDEARVFGVDTLQPIALDSPRQCHQ